MSETIYHRHEIVIFHKTKDQWGGLSNMAAGYLLTVNGITILTSEALFQACRFPDYPDIQKKIIEQKSPMSAKMTSKPYRKDKSRPDWLEVNPDIMYWCLQVKLICNWQPFGDLLNSTGDKPIVEFSVRDDFWGAVPIPNDDTHVKGQNILGKLLVKLREEYRSSTNKDPKTVEPPSNIPNFQFYGRPIEPITLIFATLTTTESTIQQSRLEGF